MYRIQSRDISTGVWETFERMDSLTDSLERRDVLNAHARRDVPEEYRVVDDAGHVMEYRTKFV